MATVRSANLGNALQELLLAPDIEPGDNPSYQLCKTIYTHHPLGAKIVEKPLTMAMAQRRLIAIPKGPEEVVRAQFVAQWDADGCDRAVFNVMRLARMYGISTLAMASRGTPPDRPLKLGDLRGVDISLKGFDPLNTSGSLVLNQQVNDFDFQSVTAVSVQGQRYHPSRTCVIMNEDPLYIDYTTSGFGFVGRSAYQRALFPLKSFIQTMLTDDMVSLKAGVLIAKMKGAGSIVDNLMQLMAGIKRSFVREAIVGNVISITPDEDIESIDLTNIDAPMTAARRNIIENIASAVPMPAKLLLQESFAEGFGEGTEDAKDVARFTDEVRVQMQPLYTFLDPIVQHRAWTPEFYKTVQARFPEYEAVPFTTAFYEWTNSFAATWPSPLEEPESEKIKVEDVKLKAVIALLEVLIPQMDPLNKATLIEWAADNFNSQELLFTSPLELDYTELEDFEPPEMALGAEPGAPRPFADDQPRVRVGRALVGLDEAVARLKDLGRATRAVPPRAGQTANDYARTLGIKKRSRSHATN